MAQEPSKDALIPEMDEGEASESPPQGGSSNGSRITTNLMIADILVRGASTLLRRDLDHRLAKASKNKSEKEPDPLDGRTMITTLGLYAANKLATKSAQGLALVAGSFALKTLYDRGKDRQRRLALEDKEDDN